MGLLKALVLLPLAPVEGVVWVARQVQNQVDQYLLDPAQIMAELEDLQRALDDGTISEDQYLQAEDELLDRLDEIQGMADGAEVPL